MFSGEVLKAFKFANTKEGKLDKDEGKQRWCISDCVPLENIIIIIQS